MNDNCVIYDFETLGQNQQRCVVLSFAMVTFNENNYIDNPYKFKDIVEKSKYIKFDVEDQIATYHRRIEKDTVDWWNGRGEEAKKQMKPSTDDKKISELYHFIKSNIEDLKIKKSYTRGNTFDPMILQYLMLDIGQPEPFHWHNVRDTRSMIEGMSFGMNLKNDFMPSDIASEFIKHDPCHDIAIDIMRMQMLSQAILMK